MLTFISLNLLYVHVNLPSVHSILISSSKHCLSPTFSKIISGTPTTPSDLPHLLNSTPLIYPIEFIIYCLILFPVISELLTFPSKEAGCPEHRDNAFIFSSIPHCIYLGTLSGLFVNTLWLDDTISRRQMDCRLS